MRQWLFRFEASNGVEALEVAKRYAEGTIDLLLTDVVLMPKMRWLALANTLAVLRPGTKLLYYVGL